MGLGLVTGFLILRSNMRLPLLLPPAEQYYIEHIPRNCLNRDDVTSCSLISQHCRIALIFHLECIISSLLGTGVMNQ